MPTISIREATVQTVQIEIKALKVGKKQVTMGLFRQLPPKRLIDYDTLQLLGIPWGHVRYWWDSDGRPATVSTESLLHVVWQDGDTLRRDIIDSEAPASITNTYDTAMTLARKQYFFLLLREAPSATVESPTQAPYYGYPWGDFLYQEKKHRIYFEDMSERNTIMRYALNRTQVHVIAEYEALLDALELAQRTTDDCNTDWNRARSLKAQYEAGWTKHVTALQEMPQLFIAV